jgi:hypothetical protein
MRLDDLMVQTDGKWLALDAAVLQTNVCERELPEMHRNWCD